MPTTVALCVQLWPHPEQESALIDYEDRVLDLIPVHGGRVLNRVRRIEQGDAAFETHIIEFPDEEAFQAYMNDPARLAMATLRDAAIAETQVSRIQRIV
ncbi:MAG: DUF1330 domain-containing protein [Actinomycetota bacterium]|nr:DUF1330 domain-containing protein [Actinomycetota bacterium]